jgi:hypothetical protein
MHLFLPLGLNLFMLGEFVTIYLNQTISTPISHLEIFLKIVYLLLA